MSLGVATCTDRSTNGISVAVANSYCLLKSLGRVLAGVADSYLNDKYLGWVKAKPTRKLFTITQLGLG